MASRCCKGLDAVLGADKAGKYLVLHVNNPKGLVEHEKGAGIAFLATSLAPEYVEEKIYSTVADELRKQFREKGSEVDVQIVEVPPKGGKPSAVTREGVLLGILLAGLGYGAVKLVGRLW